MFEDDAMDNIVEEALDINMEKIDTDSTKEAEDMIKTIAELYSDKDFFAKYPKIGARINFELDTLRVHIKERKASEEVHDALISQLQLHPENANLYEKLTKVMKATIEQSNKIHDTMDKLDKICKEAQMNSEEQSTTIINEVEGSVHRGSKSFIQQILDREIS